MARLGDDRRGIDDYFALGLEASLPQAGSQ
jgi:hypothetical protein